MKIANFVMEIGLKSEIPTYSGGLGILAGDYAFSLAEKGIPAIFVTLLYKKGYTSQKLDRNAGQIDQEVNFDPSQFLSPLKARAQVELQNRVVWVGAWEYLVKSRADVPVLFLDTDLPENDYEGRMITDRLYGGDQWHRLNQEMILGVGGYRMLKTLGFDVDTYHLNEGHAALLTTELLREHMIREKVRKRCAFTTHTPVSAGIDIFPLDMVKSAFERYHWIDWDSEAVDGRIDLSRLALRYSGVTNAVSLKHRYVAQSVLRDTEIGYVTNGVNHLRWVHRELKKVYDHRLPGWDETPALLAGAVMLPVDELSGAHAAAKSEMLEIIKESTGVQMDKDVLTIGCAKRVTGYKNNNLILRNLEKLIEIANAQGAIQLLFSGKAHPADDVGKSMLRDILGRADHLASFTDRVRVAYLEDYDIDIAKSLVAGCDVWLNTATRPLEACGTSGMKAAMNGVLNLSEYDGWWLEGGLDGVNGWGIGVRSDWSEINGVSPDSGDLQHLYDKLMSEVAPVYYRDKERWWRMAKTSIATIGPHFNGYRMVNDYVANVYSKLWPEDLTRLHAAGREARQELTLPSTPTTTQPAGPARQ